MLEFDALLDSQFFVVAKHSKGFSNDETTSAKPAFK
jgi:hypothetical protein